MLSKTKIKLLSIAALSSLALSGGAFASSYPGLTVDESAIVNDAAVALNLSADEIANFAYDVALADNATPRLVLYHFDQGEDALGTTVSANARHYAAIYKPSGMLAEPAATKEQAREIVNAVDGAALLTEAMGL